MKKKELKKKIAELESELIAIRYSEAYQFFKRYKNPMIIEKQGDFVKFLAEDTGAPSVNLFEGTCLTHVAHAQ